MRTTTRTRLFQASHRLEQALQAACGTRQMSEEQGRQLAAAIEASCRVAESLGVESRDSNGLPVMDRRLTAIEQEGMDDMLSFGTDPGVAV